MATVATKKSVKKNVVVGQVSIKTSFNNTIVSVTDAKGNVIASSSAGSSGSGGEKRFKGSKKSTPFAAQKAAERAMEKALTFGLKTVSINVKGPGLGRESAVRAVAATDINITAINDITPIPHNGCRRKKRRKM